VLRRKPEVLRIRFNVHQGQMAISTITLMELLHGAAKSARPAQSRAEVELLMAPLTMLDFDSKAAAHAGDIAAELANKGASIGSHDILIAGHARRGLGRSKQLRMFFLETKNQTTRATRLTMPDRTATAAQTSFASFLQKRRPSF
jgi:tRNA(fMet)-specific endonuclease VapC